MESVVGIIMVSQDGENQAVQVVLDARAKRVERGFIPGAATLQQGGFDAFESHEPDAVNRSLSITQNKTSRAFGKFGWILKPGSPEHNLLAVRDGGQQRTPMMRVSCVFAGAVLACAFGLAGCASLGSTRGPAPISQYHQEAPEWEIRQVPPGERRFDTSKLADDGVAMPDATALPVRRR